MADAAQRAAGLLAARSRGDHEGASALVASFEDAMTFAGGSLLLAELLLGMYERESGANREESLRDVIATLEACAH